MKYVRSLRQRSAGTGVFFSIRGNIVRGHHVYKGALNKKYFDNRSKPAPNSEYALISEVRLTTREYGIVSKKLLAYKWRSLGAVNIASGCRRIIICAEFLATVRPQPPLYCGVNTRVIKQVIIDAYH